VDSELRLLLVEDSPEDARLLLHALGAGGFQTDCHRVEDEAALVQALEAPWDLVITDYFLPHLTGDRVLEIVLDRSPQMAVLVLSGRVGEDVAVEMMRRGASDYLLKDNLSRVPFAVGRLLQDSRVRQARIRAEAQVVRLGRMYRILSETNQAIVRISDPQDLLHEVCRLAARLGPFDRVRVLQADQTLLVTAAESGTGPAPPVFWEKHVVDTGRPVVNNDLTQGADGRYGTWEAAAIFPLTVSGRTWGCLGFYAHQREVFTSEETALLSELADDLGFGLQARTQEAQRRESEQFLADMANLVPGLFYKLRFHPTEGIRFLYVSPGIDLLLPYTPAQVLADPSLVFRAFHRGDRRSFFRAGIRSKDFLTVFNLEFRLVRPNGSVSWALVTAFPQRHPDGSVVWTGLAIDVTTQNKFQVALQHERELLTVILNNIGDGVIAVDEAGNLALVNRMAARLFDRTEETKGALPWTTLDPDLPWDARDRFQPWFRRRPDGTVLHLEAHVSDLADPGRRARGRVLLLRDMTERDRIEERLRQSEKLESIGLLAGGIAHDFNNLLTGIFGFIQLARMNADQAEKVIEYLDHALGPFQRARSLTQQLLTFAKGGEVAKTPLRVADLVPGVLRFVLEGSAVAWEVEAPEPAWAVVANEAQFHQVLENLVVNARQALPDGGHLRVRLTNVPDPGPPGRGLKAGPYLELAVADDGPGIPEAIQSKVFDPFFSTKASGTGLGLSICFSVVKKHGGSIEVESRPGQGTEFRVYWPADPRSVTPGAAGG
jgi:PAS domain S-box-containing protein